MSDKTIRIIYYISTGLITLLMLFSATMYFTQYEAVTQTFAGLGYPTYLVYPLAIAKLLGLVAIWTNKSRTLKEWAYAGFFFDFTLAATAHLAVKDGGHILALLAIVLLLVSYVFGKRLEIRTTD